MFSQAEVFIFISMAENTFVRARAESFGGENEHFDGQCLLTTKVLKPRLQLVMVCYNSCPKCSFIQYTEELNLRVHATFYVPFFFFYVTTILLEEMY